MRGERRREPHAAKAPGEEADSLQPGLGLGDQREQALQRAVEQRRLDQVERVGRGRLEFDDRLIRGEDRDPPDGAESRPVIETEPRGEAVQRLGVDLAPRRPGNKAGRLAVGGGDDPGDGMYGGNFLGKPRPAAQLPIAVLGFEAGAQFAGLALVERQRAAQLDIGDFQRPRLGPADARRRERHLQHRGGREHRHALNRVVGEPGQEVAVEVLSQAGSGPGCAKAEQRVEELRVDDVRPLDGDLVPEALALKRRRGQAARIGGSVKPRRAR